MLIDYRKLDVWRKSMLLVKTLYPLLENLPVVERYALANQMRRAVTSIVLNIAEGCGRNSNNELRHFLSIARGSAAEVEAQVYICRELGYFSVSETQVCLRLCDDIKAMLYGLMQKYS